MGVQKEVPCFSLFNCGSDETETRLAYTRRFLNVGEWDGDEFYTEELKAVQTGDHHLGYWELCQSTNKYNCTYEGQPTSYLKNNYTLSVFVKDGDALTFEVNLIDYDEDSPNDSVCQTNALIITHDLQTWSSLQDEPFRLESFDDGSGWCVVEGSISAVNP